MIISLFLLILLYSATFDKYACENFGKNIELNVVHDICIITSKEGNKNTRNIYEDNLRLVNQNLYIKGN